MARERTDQTEQTHSISIPHQTRVLPKAINHSKTHEFDWAKLMKTFENPPRELGNNWTG